MSNDKYQDDSSVNDYTNQTDETVETTPSLFDLDNEGFPHLIAPGRIRIRHITEVPIEPTQARVYIPQLRRWEFIKDGNFDFDSTETENLIVQLRNIPENGLKWVRRTVETENAPNEQTKTTFGFRPARIEFYQSLALAPSTNVVLRMARLRCEEQTEGGDDEFYLEVKGSTSRGTAIDARQPSRGEWDITDDDERKREVRDINLWAGSLRYGETAEIVVTLKEKDEGGHTDETPGAIKCFISNNNGNITIRAQSDHRNTSGGQCENLEGKRVQRFDLRNEDGHYVLDLEAPGTC